RAHPLSAALAELQRTGNFRRIGLRGLTVDEVHRMYCLIRGQEVPWSQAEAIHRQTEGNPLFVQEVLRYLVEEGLVVREGGRYVRTDGSEPDSGIPEGLRDVIGKRLSHLSADCNRLLAVAAVIGRVWPQRAGESRSPERGRGGRFPGGGPQNRGAGGAGPGGRGALSLLPCHVPPDPL